MKAELAMELIRLRPIIWIAIVITLAAYCIALFSMRKLALNRKDNILAALFVGLEGKGLLHLAVCWVKTVIFIAFLVLARQINMIEFVIFLLLMAAAFLMKPTIQMLLNQLLGGGFLLLGLFVESLILEYILQIRSDAVINIAYWLLAIVLSISALAVLVREAEEISLYRNYFDEAGELE